MTKHLTPQEFVEQLDGELSPPRQRHLDACDGCRRQAADLRQLMGDVQIGGELPEPSPLFWDHFSQRVHAATLAESLPAAQAWWHSGWRPFIAVASVLAAVVLTVVLRTGPSQATYYGLGSRAPSGELVADLAPGADEESLNFVANVAATMPYEEVRQVAEPSSDATDAMVEQLTPQQRVELVRLVKAEMRGGE